jgi:hypothetical protein
VPSGKKLLGGLTFVSRTFESGFKETPYVLDMDANLYIGPADQYARDEHAAIEVICHFLAQTRRVQAPPSQLLKDRGMLLEAFGAFDDARMENGSDEFNIVVFGTYDGEPLTAVEDDELPGGPCGLSVNSVKRRFYRICARVDRQFNRCVLTPEQREIELRFVIPASK